MLMMMGVGWIGSIGVININEQAVKRADAKIMDALYTHTSELEVYTHTSELESQGLSTYYLNSHYRATHHTHTLGSLSNTPHTSKQHILHSLSLLYTFGLE